MKAILVSLCVMLATTHPAFSRSISVHASIDCSQWAEARKIKNGSLYEAFLVGILNGLSVGSGTEFWFAKDVELRREQVFYWMDRYCENNPLKDLFSGSVKLMNERTDGEYTRRVSSQPD